MAAAAGRAVIEVILKENLVENARRIGAQIKEKLLELKEQSPFVGDVRGEGLMIGVELVADKRTKEPLSKEKTRRLFHKCLDRGLISRCYTHNIRINPPLIINKDEAMEGCEILKDALKSLE